MSRPKFLSKSGPPGRNQRYFPLPLRMPIYGSAYGPMCGSMGPAGPVRGKICDTIGPIGPVKRKTSDTNGPGWSAKRRSGKTSDANGSRLGLSIEKPMMQMAPGWARHAESLLCRRAGRRPSGGEASDAKKRFIKIYTLSQCNPN